MSDDLDPAEAFELGREWIQSWYRLDAEERTARMVEAVRRAEDRHRD